MAGQIILNLTIGAVVSTIFVALSIRMRSLRVSGGIGAVIIGTVIFAQGGLAWYAILLSFFISSTLLTRFGHPTKSAKGVGELKAGARGFGQALGQGGIAALLAGIALLFPDYNALLSVGFVGALAEANADTWAVELGVLSKHNPRLITKFSKIVAPGTSGGISDLGESSAVAGSIFVALVATLVGVIGSAPIAVFLVALIAAVIGEHVDSALGATIQAGYYCETCNKETERRIHKCGSPTRHIKGSQLVTNEAVNFISTGAAAIIAITLLLLL
jgi:uncharacterized protein (TIGR00297 family)